jgi:RNA ligase
MSTLDHVFAPHALTEALQMGHVRAQTHPELPLTIYNYTETCAFAGAWTPVTLACRGLIVDASQDVVARPLPKFFNHGQTGAPAVMLDEPVTVTDKADGSLGIIYPVPDGFAVATRGSFASDQAVHATQVLNTRYKDWAPPAGRTVLVEIIYPGNRIVLDYNGLDDLVLLGAVDIVTGRSFGPASVPDWPGPVVESFSYPTFGAALAAPTRPGKEGLVIHVTATGARVKIKYDEYVHLHRIITGLSARRVWEALGAGSTVEEIAAPLPDEFHEWVRAIAARLHSEAAAIASDVVTAFAEIVRNLPEGWSRKDFALVAARREDRGYLFAHLDGKPYRTAIWEQVKPSADETPSGLKQEDE